MATTQHIKLDNSPGTFLSGIIEVKPLDDGFIANVLGHTEHWGFGKTREVAVADVCRVHGEFIVKLIREAQIE